jgi:hypothetical protein
MFYSLCKKSVFFHQIFKKRQKTNRWSIAQVRFLNIRMLHNLNKITSSIFRKPLFTEPNNIETLYHTFFCSLSVVIFCSLSVVIFFILVVKVFLANLKNVVLKITRTIDCGVKSPKVRQFTDLVNKHGKVCFFIVSGLFFLLWELHVPALFCLFGALYYQFSSGPKVPCSRNKNERTIKVILFDMFLKYQYTVCVEPRIPSSHLIPLTLLTCLFDSAYYVTVYCVSIVYIVLTIFLAEQFPKSFGTWYLDFLKRNSSDANFEKYCGNPFGVLKAAIKNPEFVKGVMKSGGGKVILGTVGAFGVEHSIHHAGLGQMFKYKADVYMNNGLHSSGQPFSFKPNGPSIIDQFVGRK